MQQGDRISVYPVFESLDVTPVPKIRAEPLRRTRFIADAQSGGVAKCLRMLGFDTLYENGYTDAQVARLSADEQRIVLTRDRALLMHKLINHGCYVRELGRDSNWKKSFRGSIFIAPSIPSADACAVTGSSSRSRKKSSAIGYRQGARPCIAASGFCDQCDRIYWEGSHWRRMEQVIGALVWRSNAKEQPGSAELPRAARDSFR